MSPVALKDTKGSREQEREEGSILGSERVSERTNIGYTVGVLHLG